MGRPKGSKNKVKKGSKNLKKYKQSKYKQSKEKKSSSSSGSGSGRGRGRPPGSKNKNLKVPPEEVYVVPTSHKLLGVCPTRNCGSMIASLDLESKFIYNCPKCGKRNRVSNLKAMKRKEPLEQSKKDYLSSTINVSHIDMPVLHDEVINIKINDTP